VKDTHQRRSWSDTMKPLSYTVFVSFRVSLRPGSTSDWSAAMVPLFILSKLLSSLFVSRTGSASDWCALQEALYKCIDTIQYNGALEISLVQQRYYNIVCFRLLN